MIIADDHAMYRAGVAATLGIDSEFEVVAQVEDGRAAVDTFRRLRPDIVLLDIEMPGMSGKEALQHIRRIDPDAKVLMLTTYGTEQDIQECLSAGAKCYFLRGVLPDEFIQDLHDVIGGRKRFSPEVAEVLANQYTRVQLTQTEFRVLDLLKTGVTNKEIGERLGMTERTVTVHTTHIFDKLGAKRRTEAVAIAARRGLIKLD